MSTHLAQIQSVHSTVPADEAPYWWGDLHLCTDTVGAFNSPADEAPHGGGLTPLHRYSRCIQQPQPTRLLVVGDLHLCTDTVGAFNSPSRRGSSWWGTYTSALIQSVHSTAPANEAPHSGGLTPLHRCSRCILQPQPTAPVS